jgi:hypothetical protein
MSAGKATKLAEGELVAVADAGLPRRRVGLRVKRPGDVVDHAVIVGVEAERTQGLHDAQDIRNDHHQRPGEEHNEQDALAGHALALGVFIWLSGLIGLVSTHHHDSVKAGLDQEKSFGSNSLPALDLQAKSPTGGYPSFGFRFSRGPYSQG